jgi:hypothetical protein
MRKNNSFKRIATPTNVSTQEREFIVTKGIRDYVNERFAKYLHELPTLGGGGFRAKVMDGAIKKFEISMASAATHYNHSLKMARLMTPELVNGLGRPDDKKGGRPVLNPVTVVNTRSGKPVAEGISKGAAELLIIKAGTLKNGDPKLSIKVDAVPTEAAQA